VIAPVWLHLGDLDTKGELAHPVLFGKLAPFERACLFLDQCYILLPGHFLTKEAASSEVT
jgi:hypothetical protein